MSAISTTTESWTGHSHTEVESHIKSRFNDIDNLILGDNTITNIVALTKSEYNTLATKSNTTLYLIVLIGGAGNYAVVNLDEATDQTLLEVGADWNVSDLNDNPPDIYSDYKDENNLLPASISISGSNLIATLVIPGVSVITITIHTASNPLTYDCQISSL